MFIKDGKPINLVTGTVIDEVQIVMPLSAERLAKLGITEVPDLARKDDRFFYNHLREDGSVDSPPKPRAQTNLVVWDLIKARRDLRRFDGGVKVGDYWFRSDSQASGEYTALALLGAGLPDTTVLRAAWRTMEEGKVVDMTPRLVKQILTAGFAAVAANDDAALAHKAALEACDDPSEYKYATGWPKVFGEE